MVEKVNPVPEGFHTVTPYVTVKGAAEAIQFYKRAFGAVHIFLYVEDADAVFDRAVTAGATELMPVEDSGDGDRRGGVTDPFGHVWYIATHVEDISREDLQKRYDNV